ncbi:hypothetical protein BZA77DRAFT_252017 [Pyronema omphalodes]|nr:hypothetical protein BZA77DRAFT_252017 [Pyronema omphalodes]
MTATHGSASVTHKSASGKPRKSGTGTRSRKNSIHSNIAGDVVKESTGFIKDVMGTVYWLIRKPLKWILSIVLIYVLLGMAYMKGKHSLVTALRPLCNLPGMNYVGPGFCDWTSTAWPSDGGPRASREFPKLIDLQTHFEGVLENSAGSSVMALVLKESEIAVRDLTNLVKHSKLVSKDDLTARLEEFVQASKSTSRQLSRFSSRAAGVVDNLLSLDEYAIKTLENAQERIAAPYSISDIVLYPFRSDIATAEREVLATFIRATSVMDTSIRKLILEAEIALKELDDLEEKLNVIEDIAQRENVDLEEGKRDVLAQFWTKLGGNRDKLAHFDGHQLLLSDISEKRKNALKLVGGSLIHLQTMQSNLEVLRDRVAEPGLLEDAGDEVEKIPLEVHIRSIRKGVDRLNEGLQKAKGRENEYMKSMLSAHDAQIRIVESAADGRPTTRVISNN